MGEPASLETKLLVLQQCYQRHLKVKAGQFGFAAEGYAAVKTYPTIQDAIDAEAADIEVQVSVIRGNIRGLEDKVVEKLAHVVILQEV